MIPLRHLLTIFSLTLLIATIALVLVRREAISPNWLVFSGYQDEFFGERTVYATDLSNERIIQLLPQPFAGAVVAISPDGTWIYFQHITTANNQLQLSRVRILSNTQQALIRNPRLYFRAFTADGEWIILDGNYSIVRMRSDGTDMQILAHGDHVSYLSAISPDSKWVFYNVTNDTYPRPDDIDLFRVPFEGGNQERISTGLDSESFDSSHYDSVAGWSSNGEWLYFSHSRQHQNPIILRTHLDGSNTQILATGYQFATESSDGTAIILRVTAYGGDVEVYRLDLNTLNIILVANLVGSTSNIIRISPDKTWGYYHKFQSGSSHLYRVNLNTGQEYHVAEVGGIDESLPKWSPDGDWIVFTTQVDGYSKLFKARPDGSNRQMLTPIKQNEYANLWMSLPTLNWHPTRLALLSLLAITIPYFIRRLRIMPL